MHNGQTSAHRALDELRAFEARNSRDGLFLRYSRGRVRSFAMRQSATVIGGVALALFHAPATGALAVALALAGEAVDCLALARINARHRDDTQPVGAAERGLAVATAAFQALTIAACVVIGWEVVPFSDSRFFAAAFLIGTSINAGVVRPFHRASADARLAIYALTLVGLVGHDMLWPHPSLPQSPGQGLFVVGAVMMVLVIAVFMGHGARTHAARTRFEHDLLREKHRLALSQVALETQMEEIGRLAAVAENSNDSVSILDDDGTIRWVNRTFERLTGYAAHEVLGKPLESTLYAPTNPPETLALLRDARNARRAVRAEVRVCHRNGHEIWFDSARNPMTDAAGRPIGTLVVGRDITEAKAREAELARAREAAEAAARARAQFLATMSHEIRTPMNGVIATAELLAETPLTPEQARLVGTIVDSGHALLTIINDILELSRLQSGQPVLNARAFALDDCLRSVVDLLRPEAARRGLALRLAIEGKAGRVVGDDGRLRQIMLNLVGNALKFTEAGEISVTARASPAAGGLCRIAITVADTGIGIPPERLAAVFDSFTQADGEIGRRYGGTGLGLTISRLIARQMGGDITATSHPGQGSRFVLALDLPLAPGPVPEPLPAAPPAAKPDSPPGPAPGGGAATVTILIAEDNRTNAFIVERMLAGPGRALHFVANGAEAVQAFRALAPHLVLMDVAMPVLDGLAATRALRAIEAADPARPRAAVIALTANAFAEDRAACEAAGCDDFLTKPVSRAGLEAVLERYAPAASGV